MTRLLLLGLLLLSSALATPVLDRGDCPSLQQIGEALETVLGVQVKYIDKQTQVTSVLMTSSIEIPEGLLDCINGGDRCPFENLKQFRKWIRKNTGIKVDI